VTELTIDDGQPLHVKAVSVYPEFSSRAIRRSTVEKTPVEITEESTSTSWSN